MAFLGSSIHFATCHAASGFFASVGMVKASPATYHRDCESPGARGIGVTPIMSVSIPADRKEGICSPPIMAIATYRLTKEDAEPHPLPITPEERLAQDSPH